jgi:diguanylate cyclase (GGDEF)-like protein/PAS domain S-box-containing protein
MAEAIRVLFVEDQPDDVDLIRVRLQRESVAVEGRTVTTESGLRDALADFLPDVVLCDYTIPGFSGREALQIVREQAPFIPFIFVSGTIGEDTAVECLREGATDYLLKGNLSRLAAAVRRAIAEAGERAHIREVEQARARLAEILEATSDLVTMADLERNMTFINEAGCRLLGVTRDEALRHPADGFYASWARELIQQEAIPTALQRGTWQGETAVRARAGEEIPLSQVLVAHKGPDGEARFFSTIARDIRERKAYEARLRHLANFDALTGLPNRSLFGDRTAQSLVHARRTGSCLAVVAIGLDGFKRINEAFGHPVGDQVLREAAARLLASVRDGDTAARVGADEFAILLSDLARPEDVYPVVRNLLDALALPQSAGGQELRVTASAGAAIFPADGANFETLANNAGAAMRQAKSVERGNFQYYSAGITGETLARLTIETGLRAALHDGELVLHYQPQYDLHSGVITGTEALMRWSGPDGKPIGPARFIPIAEETGLIRGLGEWALAEACHTALEWMRRPGPPLTLAVNVSPLQLHGDGFAAVVARVLRTSGFPAGQLELEITESALVSDQAGALEAVARLKALGVKIAIDDFGTGYSSLSYLSRLPIDCLKIDQSFIKRMIADPRDAAIVRAVILLGHGLGLTVLAEGVETAEQYGILQEMGCDQAQGLYMSAAVAGDRLQLLLDAPPRASARSREET